MRLSYSKWSLYHLCPFKYKCNYILGLKGEAKGAAMSRGSEIHDMLENYIVKKSDQLPWEATNQLKVPAMGVKHPMQQTMDSIRNWPNEHIHAELAVQLDIDMNPLYNEEESAFIVIFDAIGCKGDHVDVFEWKSGKPYAEHAEQRHLYATAALNIYLPQTVTVTTHYVDVTGQPEVTKVTQDDNEAMKVVWQRRRETMINDKILAPRPNSKCKWCEHSKERNGICPM